MTIPSDRNQGLLDLLEESWHREYMKLLNCVVYKNQIEQSSPVVIKLICNKMQNEATQYYRNKYLKRTTNLANKQANS